jgi:hypothetical protein
MIATSTPWQCQRLINAGVATRRDLLDPDVYTMLDVLEENFHLDEKIRAENARMPKVK